MAEKAFIHIHPSYKDGYVNKSKQLTECGKFLVYFCGRIIGTVVIVTPGNHASCEVR